MASVAGKLLEENEESIETMVNDPSCTTKSRN